MLSAIIPGNSLRKLTRNLLLTGLFFHLLAAWFNVGYHHPDEYFQITEFASYKLGKTPVIDLAWEYAAGIRPAFQPAMVYCLCKLFSLHNPVIISFLLRLLSAITAWAVAALFILISLTECRSDKTKKIILYLSTVLWFLPYIHARFSSENWSAIFFFAGLSLLMLMLKPANDLLKIKNSFLSLLFCGILIGLSFVVRVQSGFMILGLGLWLLIYRKLTIRDLSVLFTGIALSFFTGVLTDRWLYGKWVFTAFNYFHVNIIIGKASDWGTSPWWDYFVTIVENNIPPFGILILAGIFIFFFRFYKHPLTWISVPFLLAHIINPHKEIRFLFPLVNALPVIAVTAFDGKTNSVFINKIIDSLSSKVAILSAKIFIVLNIILMLVTCMKPANEMFSFYDFVYDNYKDKEAYIYTFSEDPYSVIDLHVDFLKPDNLTVIKVPKDSLLHHFPFRKNAVNLVFEKKFLQDDAFHLTDKKSRIVYRTIPERMKMINFNNWLKRSRIWRLYEVD